MKWIFAIRSHRFSPVCGGALCKGGPALSVVAAVLAVGLMSASARADVIPQFSSVIPITTGPDNGDFLWTYNVIVTQSEEVQANAAAPTPTTGNYLTLYDIAGLVSGSETMPAGWTVSEQTVGVTPNIEAPPDDGGVLNITWNYSSGPNVAGLASLGTFTFVSTDGNEVFGSNFYAGQATAVGGEETGTVDQNIGHITAPEVTVTTHSSVPLPSGSMIGAMLCGLVLLGHRHLKRSIV